MIGQSSSIYGLHKDTVSSMLLTMLPPLEHDYSHRFKQPSKSTPAYEVRNRLMEMTLEALKKNAGFVIPEVRLKSDIKCMNVQYEVRSRDIYS